MRSFSILAFFVFFVGVAHAEKQNILDRICGDELVSRTEKANALFKNKEFEKAFSILEPCSLRLKNGSEAKNLLNAARKEIEKSVDREVVDQRRQWKLEGVSIGMTRERVRLSSWGEPRKINTTTNVYGVSEQWVYDGGYLYFKDGILTSIQN